MKALLGAAQKLEEMGLIVLAQAQYDRISLLGTVKLSSQSSTTLNITLWLGHKWSNCWIKKNASDLFCGGFGAS
jgi:hypothetical protein